MRTTKFGSRIVDAAEEILQFEYRSGSRNYFGDKLEQLVQEFDSFNIPPRQFKGRGKAQPNYCGITISVILDRAMRKFNDSVNTYRNANAKWFVDEARRRNLRIDKLPQPGCVFVTLRSGGSGHHVGIVWDVVGSSVKTIEGNTFSSSSFHVRRDGCKIKLGAEEYGILSRMRPISKVDSFIHIEELFGKETFKYEGSDAFLADSGASCPVESMWWEYDLDPKDGYPPEFESNPAIKETELLGLPAKYVYIGGGVLGFLGLCLLFRRSG